MSAGRLGICGLMALMILIVSGCDGGLRMFSSGKPDYVSLSRQLMGQGFKDTLAKEHAKALSSSAMDDSVQLQVRRLGDVREPLTESDLKQVKQAIYDKIGYTFKLELSAYNLGDVSHTQGRVTAIDGTRLLIVDEARTIGADKSPDAAWYDFALPDASLRLAEGDEIALEEIGIGYRVRAWSEGLMLTSYPGQTGGLALDVLDRVPGEPDLTGEVAEVRLASSLQEESYLLIGATKVVLSEFTQYIVSGEPATAGEVRVGDEVEIRTTGLPSGVPGEVYASHVKTI
ncbi:hypothetical protein [Cohnella fermenti]|uniref:Uncharacterized protein n=1 Tax=Cohnella fermenti TaxID=2565925 RepID=A0A4S4BY61_9BACL|nr:hypothetical protein [Cohnella fermenti]THF79472.1 hypothetical protein E6C55_11830 [Cohnella fermenti]